MEGFKCLLILYSPCFGAAILALVAQALKAVSEAIVLWSAAVAGGMIGTLLCMQGAARSDPQWGMYLVTALGLVLAIMTFVGIVEVALLSLLSFSGRTRFLQMMRGLLVCAVPVVVPIGAFKLLENEREYISEIEHTDDQGDLVKAYEIALKRNDHDALLAVASNKYAPPRLLTDLSQSHYVSVRQRVAEHPSTPPPALDRLLRDADWVVRSAALSNRSMPVSKIVELLHDPEEQVRVNARHRLDRADQSGHEVKTEARKR